MPQEVSPGIYRITIPAPDDPQRRINVYAFTSNYGLRLVDCGWDTPEAYETLRSELADIGAEIRDIREIVLTHTHPDHYGLATRLIAESGAHLYMHHMEADSTDGRRKDLQVLTSEINEWMKVNGVPVEESEAMSEGLRTFTEWPDTPVPDVRLSGGEQLEWGDRALDVLWAPGHSAGLICLIDRTAGVLLSSDHVLEHITPHVGQFGQRSGDVLGEYLQSLQVMNDLECALVLPGHGDPFWNLQTRVGELIRHHHLRLDQMAEVLSQGPCTPYTVAKSVKWRGSNDGWQKLTPFHRRMALAETIAHLDYLHSCRRATKQMNCGVALYAQVLTQ